MGKTEQTKRSKGQVWLVIGIVLGAVLIDQIIKLYVATHFALGESHEITSWFWLCFVENNGMAFGIDAFAHRGTLDAYGKTIAVLGCGVDQCYPPGNQMLYRQIAEQGLIISEYPPGMTSRPGFFPMRNRLIAGLSRAVIVVEAARRSGSLITADLAMDMNKPVFAVPGPINENTSEGTNRLIQQGAVLLQDWDDVVRELRDELAVQPEVHFEDETTQQVWERVGWVAVYPDTMMQHLKLPPQKVMQCLTQLEMSGYVERLQDGSYIRIQ